MVSLKYRKVFLNYVTCPTFTVREVGDIVSSFARDLCDFIFN